MEHGVGDSALNLARSYLEDGAHDLALQYAEKALQGGQSEALLLLNQLAHSKEEGGDPNDSNTNIDNAEVFP